MRGSTGGGGITRPIFLAATLGHLDLIARETRAAQDHGLISDDFALLIGSHVRLLELCVRQAVNGAHRAGLRVKPTAAPGASVVEPGPVGSEDETTVLRTNFGGRLE